MEIVDSFKDLGLNAPNTTPSFSLQDLSDDFPRILQRRDPKRLKALEPVFSHVPLEWLFPKNDAQAFIEVLKRLLLHLTDLEQETTKVDESLDDSPAPTIKGVHLSQSEDVLSLVLSLLSRIQLDSASIDPGILKRVIRNAILNLLTCLSLYSGPQLWNNKKMNLMGKELEEILLGLNQNSCLTELLMGWQGSRDRSPSGPKPLVDDAFMKKFLNHVTQPYLTKDKFAKQPLKRASFLWLLEQVDSPHLSEFKDLVFPATFLFLDSICNTAKVLGIRCLTEILQKIQPIDVLIQNRHLVVIKSLLHQLHFRQMPLLQAVHPCILIFLERYHLAMNKCKEPDWSRKLGQGDWARELEPSKEDIRDQNSPANRFFDQILSNLEMESDLAVRRETLRHLGGHIRGLGIAVCRFLRRLLTVLTGVLEFQDDCKETARLLSLEALDDAVRVARPRVPPHAPKILKSLLRLMMDVACKNYSNSEFTSDNVLEKCKTSLLLLLDAAPHQVKILLAAIPVSKMDSRVQAALKDVQDQC